jgi:hypothetical protein
MEAPSPFPPRLLLLDNDLRLATVAPTDRRLSEPLSRPLSLVEMREEADLQGLFRHWLGRSRTSGPGGPADHPGADRADEPAEPYPDDPKGGHDDEPS